MGRSNLSGATLKKQSRRYVNPSRRDPDRPRPGGPAVRAAPRLDEHYRPFETRSLIGWSRTRRSRAQCLPAFVIVASARRAAGCADGDSEPDSPVSTQIRCWRGKGTRISTSPSLFRRLLFAIL